MSLKKMFIQSTYNEDWFCDSFLLVFLYTLVLCSGFGRLLKEWNDVLQVEVAYCDPAPAE